MVVEKLRSEMRMAFDGVNARFGQIQARFNAMEARFDTLERRLTAADERMAEEGEAIRRHVDIVAEEFKHYRQVLSMEEAAARRDERLSAAAGA